MAKTQQMQHKIHIYFSLMKEKIWLEQMAQDGWFLKNIEYGIRYTFEKKDPKRMVYEIDRFHLPKKPSRSEIRAKEEFLSIAKEMGWKEICHDEVLNYYLAKEYQEGDINELYNEPEARMIHAEKYQKLYGDIAHKMLKLVMVLVLLFFFYESVFPSDLETLRPNMIHLLRFIKGVIVGMIFGYLLVSLFLQKLSLQYAQELSLSEAEWIEKYRIGKEEKKVKVRIFFSMKNLRRFLEQQSLSGWHIAEMTPFCYTFQRGEKKKFFYSMDTKYLVNIRKKQRGEKEIADKKDRNGWSSDWQVESLKEAEELGYEYICAIDSRAVLYRTEEQPKKPLNELRYENGYRLVSVIGVTGLTVLAAGFLGAVIGAGIAYLMLIAK